MDGKAHALNRAIATKLAFEILDFGAVTEARNKQGSQRITNDVWVLVRLDWRTRSALKGMEVMRRRGAQSFLNPSVTR